MFSRLQTRLLLFFVLVVILAVGLAGLLANRVMVSQFGSYLDQRSQETTYRIAATLKNHYTEYGSWDKLGPTVSKLAEYFDARIIVLDVNHRTVADSEPDRSPGKPLDLTTFTSLQVVVNDFWVGNILISPLPGRSYLTTPELKFLGTLNRYLIWSAVLAGLVAVIVAAILSRRITTPINEMTAAASQMASGNLKQRVRVTSGDEIQKLGTAFNAMADSLAKMEELRQNMVADIAHELRTPLTTIQGYLEGLRDGVIEPTRMNIASIHEETIFLARLVSDLQELSLADAGELSFDFVPTDISEVLRREAARAKTDLRKKKIAVTVDLPKERLPKIQADPDRLGQVVRNLLNNSSRHTPGDGEIVLSARRVGAMIRVRVSDNGSGISPEDLPCIFERFYRVDKSRARSSGGTGVGLAIAKRIIESHGGAISAESTPGEGATVIFDLPIDPQGEAADDSMAYEPPVGVPLPPASATPVG